MDGSSLFILHVIFLFLKAEAQQSSLVNDYEPSQGSVSSFQPSLAVVIGVLILVFTLTFTFLIYFKFYHTSASASRVGLQNLSGLVRSGSRDSGIDKAVIESLPFFRFSSLKGTKEGLECAVCLSRFEDIEILRLLPKCKHAFHIQCVDQWLESHSSCPLCRCKVSPEDPTLFTYTNSMRFMGNDQSERLEDSNIELFVEREENCLVSSRFSIGSSFRRGKKSNTTEEQSLIKEAELGNGDDLKKVLMNKHNHKIFVSDVVLKNRWSSVSSSDLMYLNSELLNELSSDRFSSLEVNDVENTTTRAIEDERNMENNKEREREKKGLFENKVNSINRKACATTIFGLPSTSYSNYTSKTINSDDRRSMSEITVLSRFRNLEINNMVQGFSSGGESNAKEERLRMMWLSMAKRTAQWFVNRERKSQHTETEATRHKLHA